MISVHSSSESGLQWKKIMMTGHLWWDLKVRRYDLRGWLGVKSQLSTNLSLKFSIAFKASYFKLCMMKTIDWLRFTMPYSLYYFGPFQVTAMLEVCKGSLYILSDCWQTHTQVHMHNTHMHACTRTHTHTGIYTQAHTHTDTHSHSLSLSVFQSTETVFQSMYCRLDESKA